MGPVLEMKASEVVSNWPPKRWARDDAPQASSPPIAPDDLRLRWFGTPDGDGWFRITAADSEKYDWSTYCRVDDIATWPALELALSAKLHSSLKEIGTLDLGDAPPPDGAIDDRPTDR